MMKVLTFGEIMLRLKAPGHERFCPEPRCWRLPSAAARPTWPCRLANYGMDVGISDGSAQ